MASVIFIFHETLVDMLGRKKSTSSDVSSRSSSSTEEEQSVVAVTQPLDSIANLENILFSDRETLNMSKQDIKNFFNYIFAYKHNQVFIQNERIVS
jgi:hypothetical protein